MLRGLLEGILGALCFLYALQTRVMYPAWMLQTLDHPWIIVLSTILCLGVSQWSPKSGVCLMLMIVAFIADVYVFSRIDTSSASASASDIKTGYVRMQSDWLNGWLRANGDYERSAEVIFGPPLDAVPLSEPVYPRHALIKELPAGPAPFLQIV